MRTILLALLPHLACSLLPVWPAPRGPVSMGAATVQVSPALSISGAEQWPDVAAGVTRFLARAFPRPLPAPHRRSAAPAISALVLNITHGDLPLQLGVDESYALTVPSDAAQPLTLTAATQYGALAGLETLSQLLAYDTEARAYAVAGTPLQIADSPAFAWRGLLVDTARHFLPIPTLRATLDSMSYAKLNVLHWHIVDAQSWPLESTAWPALWQGAFSPLERYTTEDVQGLVEYARARGIRTVFEVDHPGHASSACKGYPQLCPSDCAWDAGANSVPLAPASNDTWALLADTLAELAALSPDAFLHLGGDEVDTTCWALDAATRAWVAASGLSGVGAIYGVFVQRMNAAALALGRSPLRWEDAWAALGTALDPATVVHVWLSPDTLGNVTSAGYRALYSYQGLYNDIVDYQHGWYLNGLWQPWAQMYDVDMLAGLKGGNASARELVLGGEAAQWGESADGSDVLQTVWPRAAAIAERLWAYDMQLNSSSPGVAERLAGFRCLLLARGVPASPLNTPIARSPPTGPGSCLQQ